MDIFDRAEIEEARHRKEAIRRARNEQSQLNGEPECIQCKQPNNLFRKGFAVCSSCREENIEARNCTHD